MSMLQASVPYPTVALTAATAKTVVGIKAPANQVVKVLEYKVSFDGATSTNAPAIVEITRNTFGANPPGTNSTSATPNKLDPGRAETVQTTAGTNWTTEPTTQTQHDVVDVGQYNGVFAMIYPFAAPLVVVGGQGASVRITSPNNVNSSGRLLFEE